MVMQSVVMAQLFGGGGTGGSTASTILSLVPFALIFVIFYFLVILPQQKRAKQQKALLEALKKGDKVVTASGIWGTVTNLGKATVTLQIADTTKIRIQRDQIARLRGGDDEEKGRRPAVRREEEELGPDDRVDADLREQTGEDGGETGNEDGGRNHAPMRCDSRFVTGDHAEVGGHQWQHARVRERCDAGAEQRDVRAGVHVMTIACGELVATPRRARMVSSVWS